MELFRGSLWPKKFPYPSDKSRFRVRINGKWRHGHATFTLSNAMAQMRGYVARKMSRKHLEGTCVSKLNSSIKLKELAERISAHLKRFEANQNTTSEGGNYFMAGSFVAGRYIAVRYVDYQGVSNLTKQQAITYLTWLDAGNVGKHWKMRESYE